MYQLKKSKTKQFVAGLIGATLALSFAFAVTVKADSVSDLTAQINSLLATITSLQSKLAAVQGGTPTAGGYTFTSNLMVGSKGAEVKNLQKVLNMSADTQIAASGAGSPGNETSTFGPATKAAVIKWQKKSGVSATGYVGPLSRAKLNAGSTTTTTTTPTTTAAPKAPAGTGLTVSSPTQPAVTIAPYKASRVPFTKVTLTAGSDGDVTVNSLTVQRTGLATDAAFSSIVLLDENGLQIGTSKTFNSNHQTTLGEPFVVSRGTSRTLTIAGNMETTAGGYSGQVASLTVVGVNTSATISGALPITGAGQTVNETLTLGTADLYVSQFDPSSALTKNIGDTGLKFTGVKVTAGSAEDVTLWSIRWNQVGSAGSGDITNIKTVLDGTSYPTIVSADGKYYTTLFPNGVVVQKGFSKDLYITGDLVGSSSSSRTVEFDIYDASDLYLSGNTYNFGILGAGTSTVAPSTLTATSRSKFTTGSPFYAGSIVTISAGTVTTINKSSTVALAANIAVNVPNQILGAYETNIKGEPISVQSTVFHLNSSAAYASNLIPTSISLIDKNGSVVAGPKDAVAGTAASELYKVTFTDTITYPVGVGTYTLVGKLTSNWTNGSTFMASTTPSSDWSTVKGQITGNSLTLTNAVFSMNTMTIRTANLTVAASNNPAAQTVVAGTPNYVFTNIQLDATQSGEDIRIATLPLTWTYSAGSGNDVSSCRVYDGALSNEANNLTTGSNPVNPTTAATGANYTFTLDKSLTILKGTVKTLSIACNVSGASTALVGRWEMTAARTTDSSVFVVTGQTSTQSVTATGSSVGAYMTVGTATLSATPDNSGTSYKVVSANTSGVPVAAYQFKAINDSINLTRLVLKLTNTASSSSSDVQVVHVFDGNTEVGSASFLGGAITATTTFKNAQGVDTPVFLTRGTEKVLTIKVDLLPIGGDATSPIPSGHLINVDIDTNDAEGTYGTGVGSGIRVNSTGSTSVAGTGLRVFKSYPTVALVPITTGTALDGKLLRFSITADTKGDVGIAKFLINIATSTITNVNTVNIFAFDNLNFSGAGLSGMSTGGQLAATSISTSIRANSPDIAIYPQTSAGATTTIKITAGTTAYFEVRGTVTGVVTGSSVVTTLKGDTAYPTVNATQFMTTLTSTTTTSGRGGPTAGDAAGNSALNSFLWSPLSTTTASATGSHDWTNGYAIPGLPSNGINQGRGQNN